MESDIVKRKIKIFIIGLQKNDPEIMPDPPVKYLENANVIKSTGCFPLPSYIIIDRYLYDDGKFREGVIFIRRGFGKR